MIWLLISALVAIIDQVTKYIVIEKIDEGQMIPVLRKFFYLTHHKNTGGAWGIFQDGRLFFLIIIPVISVFLVYFLVKNKNSILRISLALILGGALGNYIDRIFLGNVTDFLLFYIGTYPFPVFNAADVAITCGTILLGVYILFIHKDPADLSVDKKAGLKGILFPEKYKTSEDCDDLTGETNGKD